MYNVHLTHSLLCFEFVEFTLNKNCEKKSRNLYFMSINYTSFSYHKKVRLPFNKFPSQPTFFQLLFQINLSVAGQIAASEDVGNRYS